MPASAVADEGAFGVSWDRLGDGANVDVQSGFLRPAVEVGYDDSDVGELFGDPWPGRWPDQRSVDQDVDVGHPS